MTGGGDCQPQCMNGLFSFMSFTVSSTALSVSHCLQALLTPVNFHWLPAHIHCQFANRGPDNHCPLLYVIDIHCFFFKRPSLSVPQPFTVSGHCGHQSMSIDSLSLSVLRPATAPSPDTERAGVAFSAATGAATVDATPAADHRALLRRRRS